MSLNEIYDRYLTHFGPTISVRDHVAGKGGTDCVILRHDIDYSLDIALEVAHREHIRGCRASYYVLHTADYMDDPLVFEKCLQIQDYGHEVGIHLNFLTQWFSGQIDDVGRALEAEISRFRRQGVEITTVAAHGDRACYEHGFTNYWPFAELRPDDPAKSEASVTAEGIVSPDGDRSISYPTNGHRLQRPDGASFDLWSLKLSDFGLSCEASRLDIDTYFTDSGGRWKRSADPLSAPMPAGRSLVLMHPLYWRGEQRFYYFLSTARSGSKWLAKFLDEATSVRAVHEHTFNHVMRDGKLVFEKRTGAGFTDLLEDGEEAQRLLLDSYNWASGLLTDFAEANIYLEQFLDVLPRDDRTTWIHLHRDPRAVVRSLRERQWYEVSPDDRHPPVDVPGWESASQTEQICWYVRDVNARLLGACQNRLAFESMTGDLDYLSGFLESIGITVYPRLAARLMGTPVNATSKWTVAPFDDWPDEDQEVFSRLCSPVAARLGYEFDLPADHVPLGREAEFSVPSEREPPPVTGLLTQATSMQPGRITVRGCVLQYEDGGVCLTYDREANGYALVGGGHWTPATQAPFRFRQALARGITPELAVVAGGWPTAGIESFAFSISTDIQDPTISIRVICLTYDERGALIGTRDIATLTAQHPKAALQFMPGMGGRRFNLALYRAKGPGTNRVQVSDIRLASMPWEKARGFSAESVLERLPTGLDDGSKVIQRQEDFAFYSSRSTGLPGVSVIAGESDSGELIRIQPGSGEAGCIYMLNGRWHRAGKVGTLLSALDGHVDNLLPLLMTRLSRSPERRSGEPKLVGGMVSGRPVAGKGRAPLVAFALDSAGKRIDTLPLGAIAGHQGTVSFRMPVPSRTARIELGLRLDKCPGGVEITDATVELVS